MPDYRDRNVKDFEVKLITRKDVRDFIEKWHYSQSINGLRITYVFGLFCDGDLIGAMIYGLSLIHI